MENEFSKNRIALAVIAAIGTLAAVPTVAMAAKTPGKYVSGDFHNHTTCSDGAISMQKLVKKSTDKSDGTFGLDWFVQAGHGGNGNRNCTLVEDESLATPAYPFLSGSTPFDLPTLAGVPNTGLPTPQPANPSPSQYRGPQTLWAQSIGAASVKGNAAANSSGVPGAALSSQTNPNMWRWQAVQEYQYPLIEYLAAYRNEPLFIGVETVAPGHEHVSMSVITGQIPEASYTQTLPNTPGYTPQGNANALAQWEYCFDRNDNDWSRGNNSIAGGVGNNWDCSVTGSLNGTDPSWIETAKKLDHARLNGVVTSTGTGNRGHIKTLEALKWMKEFHPDGSYYVPAHLERAGPFNPNGNNGFNIEHLRNFNNAAPKVAFGFETQPGHHASDQRGEYTIRRNNFSGTNVDSVGGTTFGGTGVYGAEVGGIWDALLGEGRNWWFFASSDWHNRGIFGPDDVRSTQDFYPGEYQRNYTMVRNGNDKLRPQTIVDGLRSGNTWTASGQLIDRLGFIACASYRGPAARSNASVEALAMTAASNNTDIDKSGCATMGEKLVVRPGAEIVVSIVVRDPAGTNYSPYAFSNPSLIQVGINQPLNAPALDHVDVIRGLVTGYKSTEAPDYAGEWPRNWLNIDGTTADLSTVPDAAKNNSAEVVKTFNNNGWTIAGNDFLKMTYRIPAVTASQYVRLRGTNLPASVPFETDADGNPLADLFTNAAAVRATTGTADQFAEYHFLRIPCTVASSTVPDNGVSYAAGSEPIEGCPSHLPVKEGVKYSAYDVAAWADLWFYSNPIYVQVNGSTTVAGVK